MMEEKMGGSEKKYEVDAFLDVSLRRTFYSSLAGAFAGLLFFRSPSARWASFAFGAGLGIGSAYSQCYPPNPSHTPIPIQNVPDSE